jgi:hypothetical protein
MLIHPITLYLCDRFRSFRRILDFIASRETVFMSDLDPGQQRGLRATDGAAAPNRTAEMMS